MLLQARTACSRIERVRKQYRYISTHNFPYIYYRGILAKVEVFVEARHGLLRCWLDADRDAGEPWGRLGFPAVTVHHAALHNLSASTLYHYCTTELAALRLRLRLTDWPLSLSHVAVPLLLVVVPEPLNTVPTDSSSQTYLLNCER